MDIFLLGCISSTFWGAFRDISPLEKYFLLKDTPFPGGNVNTAMSFPHTERILNLVVNKGNVYTVK